MERQPVSVARTGAICALMLALVAITVGGCGGGSQGPPLALVSTPSPSPVATPTPSVGVKSGGEAPTRAFPVL